MSNTKSSGHHRASRTPLGTLIRAQREAAGMSVTELAVQAGISRPYLSRLERGEYSHPSMLILKKIAQGLHIRLGDLSALVGHTLPSDLPSFGPYLRAKHPDWPETVRVELEDFYDFLESRYITH